MKHCLLIIGLAAVMGGCKVKERVVTVIETRTDTLQITKHERDSVFILDSTATTEKQRGDTVFIERTRWRTERANRSTHDTVRVATHDSVPVPYPVTEYVERELTWWQRMRMGAGNLFIGIIGLMGLIRPMGLIEFIKAKISKIFGL